MSTGLPTAQQHFLICIQYSRWGAEISDIYLLAVHTHIGDICANNFRIQEFIFDYSKLFFTKLRETFANVIYCSGRNTKYPTRYTVNKKRYITEK